MTTEIVTPTVSEIISEIVTDFVSGNANAAIANSGYSVLERGDKMRVRNAIIARKNSALRDGKFELAAQMLEIENEFKNVRNSNRVEIDPIDELRMAIRNTAYVLREMVTGNVSPNGIDPVDLSDEFDFDFTEYFDSTFDLDNDEFDTEMALRNVPKRNSRNAPTNDIGEMIETVMAEFPENEFVRVSDIRNKMAEMELAENIDSTFDGRISARLFPKSEFTLPNWIVPVRDYPWNGKTRNGAMRVSNDSDN